MGLDERHQPGYRPLPPPYKRNPSRFPTTGTPTIVDIGDGRNFSNDKERIKQLERELAKLKGGETSLYGERLLEFVRTHPKLDYQIYDNKEMSRVYSDGKASGREEIIRYIRDFIMIYGPGEKIKPKPPKNIVKTEGASLT